MKDWHNMLSQKVKCAIEPFSCLIKVIFKIINHFIPAKNVYFIINFDIEYVKDFFMNSKFKLITIYIYMVFIFVINMPYIISFI